MGYMKFACKILFLSLVSIVSAFALAAQPKCKLDFYSTADGLSHQRITSILKDREGFMWFGSWDGINRFDGQKFISFKSSPGDSSLLGNDRIDQIVEDQLGHLWLRAYDGQVYRFDKKTERFFPLAKIISAPGPPRVNFTKILIAAGGWVWLQSASDGLFAVPQSGSEKLGFLHFRKDAPAHLRIPSDNLNFLFAEGTQRVWVITPEGLAALVRQPDGTYKNTGIVPQPIFSGPGISAYQEDGEHIYFSNAAGSVLLFNKKSKTFSSKQISTNPLTALLLSVRGKCLYATSNRGELFTLSLSDNSLATARYQTGEEFHSIYEDRSGNLWIEPDSLGAVLYKPQSRSFRLFAQRNEEGSNSLGNRFRVLEDNTGTIWVNMKSGGFGYYDTDRDAIAELISTPDAGIQKLPRLINSMYHDNSGILWITTYERELVKIVMQGNDFRHSLLVENARSISENEVRGVFYDRKNRLWLGAKGGRLYVQENGKWLSNIFANEPKGGLGQVYCIMQDDKRNVWLGTKRNGVYKAVPNIDETQYTLTHFKSNEHGLAANEFYALLQDRQGRVWIGSFDAGLFLLKENGSGTQFVRSSSLKGFPAGSFKKIRHMMLDAAGNIWIGATDGLLIMKPQAGADGFGFTHYKKIPGEIESLGNNDIQFIYRDSKNRMWLATSGGGFSQAIGNNPAQSLRFRNYTTRHGLPNDYVLSCAEDKQGNMWIATENGLSKFNPQTRTFRNYDTYEGLPNLTFSEAAVSSRLPQRELVFGTTRGYLAFQPERISNLRIDANIVLTNLQINNEDAGPGSSPEFLSNDINYVDELTLDYDQDIISIDYAILDHRAGNRQAFAYRLVGFDSSWQNDRQFRRATYTNLPPGKYVFEVKSLSTDLYANTPYKRLAITILPPPWKTWWAYLLYAIAIGVVLYFIRRNALAMLRLRNKIALEQKLAALKLNFFTNVSHELRTPLTLIVNPLEQVARKEKLTPEGASYISVARKNAERMVRFVNQLLDLRKVQSEKATLRISRIEMVTFVKKISDHFAEAARSKRIKLGIEGGQKEIHAWADAEKMDVVFYNLLGNALKFTPEGKAIDVMIDTVPAEDSFVISVIDQGPGVAKEKLQEIFEMFTEADSGGDRHGKGTGIGLALAKEFVNLHGGTIWAENNADGGLTVSVKMKLGAEHYRHDEVSFIDSPRTAPAYQTPIEQQILPVQAGIVATLDEQAPLVLLVEDNDELRGFIRSQLGEHYRVETAGDGEEGLQKAIALVPDLIVSDIMMPKMDGIQMLDKVKNNVNTSHIPVVLLSARYSVESQIEGMKYGADYYITKPFDSEFLLASIDNLLRQRKNLFQTLVQKKKRVELSPQPIVITSKDETFLKEVIRVVEAKMTDADFNIESMAETMAMSRTTFYKKFKSLAGMAPVEFLRDMRLQRAKQYLEAGGSNVSEVAYTVGFNNPKYFSTCFKEKYHVSPSEYLKAKEV